MLKLQQILIQVNSVNATDNKNFFMPLQ